jgi:hypothetical protein
MPDRKGAVLLLALPLISLKQIGLREPEREATARGAP